MAWRRLTCLRAKLLYLVPCLLRFSRMRAFATFLLLLSSLSMNSLAQGILPPDPGTANYTWINKNVFAPKCLQCHLHAIHVQQDFSYQTIAVKDAWVFSYKYRTHQVQINDPMDAPLYRAL